MFEKLVDVVKRSEIPTIYELGLEFLRIYDGKFNYREGHTVSNSLSSIEFKYVYVYLVCYVISKEDLAFNY
jgi:hypothetical protein